MISLTLFGFGRSQGSGKTTFLTKMGQGWYTDSMKNFDDKDQLVMMLRALIVNDDEMAISNKYPLRI